MSKDYVFHFNWADKNKKLYRVGILAQIDDFFYFIIRDKERAERAYKNGFIGVSGFKPEEIYKSKELFDFFKSRVSENARKTNPCEELVKNRGVSMIDSFSVEEVPERTVKKYSEIILKTHELQTKKLNLKEKSDEQPTNKVVGMEADK